MRQKWPVTLWIFSPLINGLPWTVRSRINGPPPDRILQPAYLVPPAADGPALAMMSVEPEEWDRKAEAGYVISLTLRLGFCGELNNST